MGLDFIGSEAHWSYSGFMRFRERLAKQIGLELLQMQGFGSGYGHLRRKGETEWPNIDDPILILLQHSDCEGKISAIDCAKIAPRLREMIKNWSDTDYGPNEIEGYDKKQAVLLAEGMEECAAKNISLEFC